MVRKAGFAVSSAWSVSIDSGPGPSGHPGMTRAGITIRRPIRRQAVPCLTMSTYSRAASTGLFTWAYRTISFGGSMNIRVKPREVSHPDSASTGSYGFRPMKTRYRRSRERRTSRNGGVIGKSAWSSRTILTGWTGTL